MDKPEPSASFGRKIKYFAFTITPALIFFLSIEIILRLFNFQYANTPLEMKALAMDKTGVVSRVLEFNNQDSLRFIKDSKQLWVPTPERSPLKKFTEEKPKGVIRVLVMGDSCTAGCHGTDKTYPQHMEEFLRGVMGPRVQVLNGGVGSHSSYQGLQRLKYEGLKYHPDVITVFYGWNDHWVSARQDKDVKFPNDFTLFFVNLAERSRIYQVLNYFITKYRAANVKLDIKFRVLPDDYKNNLHEMVQLAKENGAKIALVTAPYDLSHFEPRVYFPFPKENLIPVHEQYNSIVREVARRDAVLLIDLAKWMKERKGETVFSRDGIHFNPTGCKVIGETIAKALLLGKVF